MIPQTNLQHIPEVNHPFSGFPLLKNLICKYGSSEQSKKEIIHDLEDFERHYYKHAERLSYGAELHPPVLEQYNVYGHRIDEIKTSEEWRKLHALSATCRITSLPYEKEEDGRFHWFIKLLLFAPVSGLYCCPLAMTDGAARCLLELKKQNHETYHPRFDETIRKLTSSDPKEHWSSGQWMTEYSGGSDVGASTTTVAIKINNAENRDDKFYTHYLTGMKWFTSATDCDCSLALAREYNDKGELIKGSKGLSLFYVELRGKNKQLKKTIKIIRLKNKLGTRQMPTAELELNGLEARRIGDKGKGVALIANMINITRIHNAISATADALRGHLLSVNYNQNRYSFGDYLINKPLQLRTLLSVEIDVRAMVLFTALIAFYLNKKEKNPNISEKELQFVRFFTPILKLHTAKYTVKNLQESMESIGGVAYLENSYFPALFRDAHVLPIWEGTTNVLSADVIRAYKKDGYNALDILKSLCLEAVAKSREITANFSEDTKDTLEYNASIQKLENAYTVDLPKALSLYKKNESNFDASMRVFSFGLGNLVCSYCLLDYYNFTKEKNDFLYFQKYVSSYGCYGLSNGKIIDVNSIQDFIDEPKQCLTLAGQHLPNSKL